MLLSKKVLRKVRQQLLFIVAVTAVYIVAFKVTDYSLSKQRYTIYSHVSVKDLQEHLKEFTVIFKDFECSEFSTKEAKECFSAVLAKDTKTLKTCAKTVYQQGAEVHRSFERGDKNKYQVHDAGHTLWAIAKTAEYLINGNEAAFWEAKHDVSHAYTKDLAS
jgi:hypothetical protein